MSNFYTTPENAARRYSVDPNYMKHRIRHSGGEFTIRAMTFRVNDQGRVALVARETCVCCGYDVTPNRHRKIDGQVVCVTCHRKAFVKYDRETRDKLGLA